MVGSKLYPNVLLTVESVLYTQSHARSMEGRLFAIIVAEKYLFTVE